MLGIHNSILWLSNMADTFAECACVCQCLRSSRGARRYVGFFSRLCFSGADWLDRQTPITWWLVAKMMIFFANMNEWNTIFPWFGFLRILLDFYEIIKLLALGFSELIHNETPRSTHTASLKSNVLNDSKYKTLFRGRSLMISRYQENGKNKAKLKVNKRIQISRVGN